MGRSNSPRGSWWEQQDQRIRECLGCGHQAGVDDVGFRAFVDVDGVVRTETAKSHTRAVIPTPSEPRLCAGQEFATPDRNPLQSALSGITALREVFEELFSDSRPGETSDELSATSGFVAPGGRDGV